jgi:hypothetical protein
MRWDAARAASKRAKRWDGKLSTKVVGERITDNGQGTQKFDDSGYPGACSALEHVTTEPPTCIDCGHTICSCEPIGIGLKKLKALVLAHPDYELVPYKYQPPARVWAVDHTRSIYVNPAVLRAFAEERIDAEQEAARIRDHIAEHRRLFEAQQAEEDENPGLQLTDAEREKMARIGGLDGCFAVIRDRLGIVSGMNSVARGEARPMFQQTATDGADVDVFIPFIPKDYI